MKVIIMPTTRLGTMSVGLIVLLFALIILGTSATGRYEDIASGDTIVSDLSARPLVGTFMLSGFVAGIAGFASGLWSILKHHERSVLVFTATGIGGLLFMQILFEIAFPH